VTSRDVLTDHMGLPKWHTDRQARKYLIWAGALLATSVVLALVATAVLIVR
jgi:hypothetical protein